MSRKPAGPRGKKTGPVRDWHLWHAVGKTVDPLVGRKSVDPKAVIEGLKDDSGAADTKPAKVEPPRFAHPPMPSSRPMIAASKANRSDKPIEPGLKKRLARGHLPIDGTLDLHGMTQIQAQAALTRFVAARAARGDRTLLVVTGKGIKKTGYLQLEQRGVLREMVPLWLNAPELAPLVAGIDPAHQSHGGGGALYVRLKRRRQM